MKTKKCFFKPLILASIVFILGGCGGGGDSGKDTTTEPQPPTTPTNHAPVISGLPASYSIDSGDTKTLTVKVSDADGDKVTTAMSASGDVTASLSGTTITLVAKQVDNDSTGKVIVTVNDSKTTTTFTINVTVKVAINNTPPTITGLSTTYTVKEGGSLTIPYVASDADGDPVTTTVSVSGNLPHTYTQSEIYVDAPQVDADTMYTFSVSSTDGKDTVVKTFTLTVKNAPQEPTKAPVIAWDSEKDNASPYFSAVEQTSEIWTFNVTDADTDESLLSIKPDIVLFKNNSTNTDSYILEHTTVVVDKDTKSVKVTFPDVGASGYLIYNIALVAKDNNGNETKSAYMQVYVGDRGTASTVRGYSGAYALPNLPTEVKLDIIYSISDVLKVPEIESVTYVDPAHQGLMNISDINGVSFVITPNASLVNQYVLLDVTYVYYDNGQGTKFKNISKLRFKVLDSTSVETAWLDQKELTLHKASFAGEYTTLSLYFIDKMHFEGKLNDKEYLEYRQKIEDTYYNIVTSYVSAYESRLNSYLDRVAQYNPNAVEASFEMVQSYITSAVGTIDTQINYMQGDSLTLLNEVAELSGNMINFQSEKLVELPNEIYSRYIGNDNYGSYNVNGEWVFSDAYKFMSILM
uniref:Cadherin domain-containing protein n=1 Tax=Shewanella sp. (strain MR-7) TaxID=60481 RepID=Q0HW86_SHESR